MVGTHHPRRLTVELQRISDYLWEIPRQGGMRVPGRIYASEKLMAELRDDPALEQVANVAHLPGIVGHALAMPDIHWGYGFPIGGVAAVDAEEGAISPGGIGFDINCGVRLLRTALVADDLRVHLDRIADALYQAIPAGVGSEGAIPKLTRAEEKQMLARGAAWAVAREFGRTSDLEATEEGGCLRDADPDAVSDTALERGRSQVGTLGSGNHFLEVQRVDEVYDARAAAALGLAAAQVTVMIHSGSRGLGYQVCDDALRTMGRAMARYGFSIPGDMGRYSFLLLGTAGAMAETFGTTCHGAGRVMSRAQAKKAGRGLDLVAELARRGVIVRAQSLGGVAEEMPWAYKDVADVVEVVDRAGLARRIARLKPLAVVKG